MEEPVSIVNFGIQGRNVKRERAAALSTTTTVLLISTGNGNVQGASLARLMGLTIAMMNELLVDILFHAITVWTGLYMGSFLPPAQSFSANV